MHIDGPSDSDSQLISLCRNGDETAYGQIVERYQSLVCSVAYSRCGDLAMSEDLAQEAFIQAWRKLDDLNDVTKFKSWVCTIVRNLATRSRERSSRNVAVDAVRLESVVEPTSSDSDPSERIITSEQEQLVWQALAEIPENYREPMILFYREEHSVAKVAESLELSSDTVKQRLSRGRKFLQEALAATVETTLKKSKPSKAFAGAVLLGLSGAKAKTATAGIAASATAKTAASSSGFAGTFLIPLAQVPMIAWLFKMAIDETRSQRERELTMQQMLVWSLAVVVFAILMFATIPFHGSIEPRALRGLVIPGMLVLFYIPMLISFRRFGKRIEQLRIDEATATPLRSIVGSSKKRGGVFRLFLASGLLVAICPAVMPLLAGDWPSVGLLLLSAIAVSLIGSTLCGKKPTQSFRCYSSSLATIAFIGIGAMFFRRSVWSSEFANPIVWYGGLLQAMAMTYVILTTVVWKRVYGKANATTES